MSNRDIDPTGDFLAATRESQGQPVDAEARKVDFGPDTDWDAAAHVRFLRRQGGASSGYTADLIQNLHCQLTAARAECEGLRAALEPFAEAWDVAVHHEDIVRHLSMAQLGELAAHEVSGVHFRNARAALSQKETGA